LAPANLMCPATVNENGRFRALHGRPATRSPLNARNRCTKSICPLGKGQCYRDPVKYEPIFEYRLRTRIVAALTGTPGCRKMCVGGCSTPCWGGPQVFMWGEHSSGSWLPVSKPRKSAPTFNSVPGGAHGWIRTLLVPCMQAPPGENNLLELPHRWRLVDCRRQPASSLEGRLPHCRCHCAGRGVLACRVGRFMISAKFICWGRGSAGGLGALKGVGASSPSRPDELWGARESSPVRRSCRVPLLPQALPGSRFLRPRAGGLWFLLGALQGSKEGIGIVICRFENPIWSYQKCPHREQDKVDG
jgi:hypothetical protein